MGKLVQTFVLPKMRELKGARKCLQGVARDIKMSKCDAKCIGSKQVSHSADFST